MKGAITWELVFNLLIGNGVEGNEPLELYSELEASGYNYTDAEKRQVREFLAYVAQFSFLTWDRETLAFAPGVVIDAGFRNSIVAIATPIAGPFLDNQNEEVMRLGMLPGAPQPSVPKKPSP